MPIRANATYRFVKSRNLVRAVSRTNYGGRGNWVVARIDSGKEMIVRGGALIDPKHPDWS